MATIGVHASHEQHAPSELRQLMRRAELLGFSSGMCSDHFHPWSERQGQSGFAWSWLGAALEATSMDLGVVCAPGQRYHPAIIAQASATLAEMFPERFWLAVGSGEALNESITGDQWPPKADRNARLREAADIIRALWRGETVNHRGLITVHEATLFTRPQKPPTLIGAALTEETARWLGSWADGLITAGAAHDGLKRIVEAFREGGGEGKPLFLQTAVSFGATDEEALAAVHDQWRHAALDMNLISDLPTARAFDDAAKDVRPDELRAKVRISASIAQHYDWATRDAELGFDKIFLHHVGRGVEVFLDAFSALLRRG